MNQHKVVAPIIVNLVIITIGCFIFAFGFNLFIFPLRILTGGVTGISIILYELFGITPALSQWSLNIPLFVLGWWKIGHEYAIKIVYGSLFLPYAIKLTEGLSQYEIKMNVLVAVIIGSALLGIGLGIILRVKGSTGGLDIPARLLSNRYKLGIGLSVGVIDITVIIVGIIVFQVVSDSGLIKGLYALISVLIMMLIIDIFSFQKK